jgi:hypothetical protein
MEALTKSIARKKTKGTQSNIHPLRKTIKPKKIIKNVLGFIIEDEETKAILESFIKKQYPKNFEVTIISMSGKASIASSSKIVVTQFLQKGVNHTFIVFNSNHFEKDKEIKLISTPLEEMGLIDNVTFIPLTQKLGKYFQLKDFDKMTKKDLELIINQHPDLREFVKEIERFLD